MVNSILDKSINYPEIKKIASRVDQSRGRREGHSKRKREKNPRFYGADSKWVKPWY